MPAHFPGDQSAGVAPATLDPLPASWRFAARRGLTDHDWLAFADGARSGYDSLTVDRRRESRWTSAVLSSPPGKTMSLPGLLREAIDSGKLTEPFTHRQASEALCRPNWPAERVRSFLERHCRGNLSSFSYYFERVGVGQYRLLRDAAGDHDRPADQPSKRWPPRR